MAILRTAEEEISTVEVGAYAAVIPSLHSPTRARRSPTKGRPFSETASERLALRGYFYGLNSTTAMHTGSALHFTPSPMKRRGVGLGIALIVIGAIILLKSLGAIAPFDVDLGFPFIMIAIAVVVGFRSGFRNQAWVFLLLIGVAHAIPEFSIGRMESDELAVAISFILLGAYVIRRRRWQQSAEDVPSGWQGPGMGDSGAVDTAYGVGYEATAGASYNERPYTINTFALFAGRKEIITSKNFHGGRVSSIFGGTQLNLMNADSPADRITIDVTAALGGVEIVVPSHWELVNEVDAIFGGVSDSRIIRTSPTETSKTLILRGFCLMGGVDVKSY